MIRTGPRGRVVGSIMTDTAESNLGDQTNGTVRGMRESFSSHPPSSKTDKAPHTHSPQRVFITSHFRLIIKVPITLEEQKKVYPVLAY